MKNRMKRMAVLGVAAMLVFGGCGEKEQKEETKTPVIENVQEEVPQEEVTIETEETTVSEPIGIHMTTNQKTYYFEEGDMAYLHLQYCDVTVDTEVHSNLKRNLENWSMERSEGLRSLYTAFEEAAAQSGAAEGDVGYSLYQNVSSARIDDAVVSLLDDTYQYMGGDRGSFIRQGINFDVKSGKRLALSDVLSDKSLFVSKAAEQTLYELHENYGAQLKSDYEETIAQMWQAETEPAWYLDASGIVIVLEEGLVGPYEMGTPEIHLPYTEFAPYIKAAYLPNASQGIQAFTVNQEIFVELPAVGNTLPLMLTYEEEEMRMRSTLKLGDRELLLLEYAYVEAAYLVRTEDEVYCLVEVDMASDDYVTFIYRLTNGVIEKVEEINASINKGNINAKEIVMESWVYLLGTYGGVKTYRFDENHDFVTEDTEYFLHRNQHALRTKAELPVTIGGAESILPAGSNIVLNATDGETYVKFTILETGQEGILNVQRTAGDYYNVTIAGQNEYDCFENLPYAG